MPRRRRLAISNSDASESGERKLAQDYFETINLQEEYIRHAGDLLRAAKVQKSPLSGALDFESIQLRQPTRLVLRRYNELDIEKWMRRRCRRVPPFFFRCPELLAEKLAGACALWFEDEGDALKRLQVHRWWQGLSNAMRYVEKQTIEGEEIDKFFFEIAKDVAKKWHFSRRMALLLEKLTAHKKGDLSVIVSAFSQLKDNDVSSILILTLEYFIGYSRLDWMEAGLKLL